MTTSILSSQNPFLDNQMGIGVFITLSCCSICESWCWLSKHLSTLPERGHNMSMSAVSWELFEHVYMISTFTSSDVTPGPPGYRNYRDYFPGFYKSHALINERTIHDAIFHSIYCLIYKVLNGFNTFNEFFVFLQTDMRFFRVGCSVKIRKNGLHDDVVFRKFDLICIYIILNN